MERETPNRPLLFDDALLAARRDRAEGLGFAAGADFLHVRVADLVRERLDEITREFRDAVIIGSGGGVYRAALDGRVGQVMALERSLRRAARAGATQVAHLDPLPLGAGTVDLALSMLEMHWLNDPVGHLIQLRRALRPDGLLIAALFGGQTLAELRAVLTQSEAEVSGGLSPRVAPMAELRDLGGLLQRAGLVMPVADAERFEVSYADAWALMREVRAMGEANVLAGRRRVPTPRAVLERAAAQYAEAFPAEGGRVRATFEVVFLTGWAPGPNQPRPRRPGSATHRLADALGVDEVSAGEAAGPNRRR